jgi:hypothetical protein
MNMKWKQFNIRRLLGSAPYWGAPVLLSLIAITQTGESTIGTLTRWKGGGFGMFSTMDSVDARFIKAYVLSDNGEMPVSIPIDFSSDELQIQTWPRQSALRNLALDLSKLSWLAAPTTRPNLLSEAARSQFPDLSDPANRPKVIVPTNRPDQYSAKYGKINVKGIKLEVWKMQLDATGHSLDSHCLMSVTTP